MFRLLIQSLLGAFLPHLVYSEENKKAAETFVVGGSYRAFLRQVNPFSVR
jgi:hypothetical protein